MFSLSWCDSFLLVGQITDTQWQIDSLHILTSKFGSLSSALTWPARFAINGELAQFFDAMEIWEFRLHIVTCITLLDVGKQHQTNKKPQNHVKWPWIEPRSHRKKKQQYAQVYVSTIYCSIYAHISVEYLCWISHTKSKHSL